MIRRVNGSLYDLKNSPPTTHHCRRWFEWDLYSTKVQVCLVLVEISYTNLIAFTIVLLVNDNSCRITHFHKVFSLEWIRNIAL